MAIKLRTVHKYISLSLAGLWFLQALTGIILVFQRELDDMRFAPAPKTLNLAAFDQGLDALRTAHPDKKLTLIYASGVPNRFEVFMMNGAGKSFAMRVDADGTVQRERPYNHDLLDAGIFTIAIKFHEALFVGDAGLWIMGASGFFLLTNIIMGLKLAWPRRGQWLQALRPWRQRTKGAAATYGWHRAVGLWFGLPALVIVSCGVLMAWSPLTAWLGPVAPPPEATRVIGPGDQTLSIGEAIAVGLEHYPGSQLSILATPRPSAPWYQMRFLQPGEARTVFGTSHLFVDAVDGSILAEYDAFDETGRVKFLNGIYPLHNGEMFGFVGRLVTLAVGIGIITMVILGVVLWRRRRV